MSRLVLHLAGWTGLNRTPLLLIFTPVSLCRSVRFLPSKITVYRLEVRS